MLAGERGGTHGHQAALAGWRPPAGAQRPRASPRRPRPLPSTLVRVRTGLLQALSGATRAECFFMMSRPPAGAPPPIAYILRPAGARLSGPVPVASGAEEHERLAAQALPPGLPAGLLSPRGSLRRPPLRAHLPRPRSHCTHAPTASCLEVAANSNVTYKCTPHAHPTGSPAPPPALGRPALQPGPSLPALSRLRTGVRAAGLARGSRISPLPPPAPGRGDPRT